MVHTREGDLRRGLADYDRAVQLAPNEGTVYALRAGAYDIAGDKARTEADLTKALRLGVKRWYDAFTQSAENKERTKNHGQ
jgi:Flp pilus assembly protein TadD